MAPSHGRTKRFDLSTGGVKDPVEGAYASGRLFDVLGVPALVGRTFTERDDARGGGPDGAVAVISHAFWRQRFNGASDAIGRRLMVDRVPFTIVGVMPPGFFGAEVGRAWHVIVPLGTEAIVKGNDSSLDGRTSWWLNVMARLKINQTPDAATAALRAVQPDIRRATQPPSYPAGEHYLSDPFTLVPAAGGRSTLRLRYTRPLAIMMGVVGAVLLIACANIANLMLARASARRHDLSVRLALGASRARIARQLLAETFILAAVGTLAGFLVSNWCSTLLVRQLATPRQTPFLDLSADWRLAAFVVAVAAATALLFGLAPALGVSAIAPSDALKEQTRTIAGQRGVALRDVLVAAQVALSLAVIVGAGLFLAHVRVAGAHAARLRPGAAAGRHRRSAADTGATSQARVHMFEALKDAASATPGVAAVGISAITPVSGQGWNTRISFAGRDVPPSAGRAAMSWVNAVSPDWFATYGMRITAGRGFTSADRLGAPPVVVVNEAFVRQFFQARNPVGDEVAAEYVIAPGVTRFRVIGVVSNAIYRSARAGIIPTMYVPMAQRDAAPASMGLTIRPQTPSGRLAGDLAESLSRAVPGAAFSFQAHGRSGGGVGRAGAAPGRPGGIVRRSLAGARGAWTLRRDVVLGEPAARRDRHPHGARRGPRQRHDDGHAPRGGAALGRPAGWRRPQCLGVAIRRDAALQPRTEGPANPPDVCHGADCGWSARRLAARPPRRAHRPDEGAAQRIARHHPIINSSSASPTVFTDTQLAAGRRVVGRTVAVREDAAREPHLRRLADAQRPLAGAADLAGKTNLAEHGRRRTDRTVAQARRHGGDDREIGRGLVDRHAAGDVDEDVLAHQVEAGALLEHGEQQREAILIDAARHPARVAVRAGADQRLHFDEQRPRTFHAAQHRRAGRVGGTLGEEQRRRIGHAFQPLPGHLEHAQLADGAEPVLHRAHDAVRVMLLALEIEHRVDDVLERLRAGEIAVLRDVADEKGRDVLPLRGEQQLRCGLAHLADAAGRRLELEREDGLDRIDDDERRAKPRDLLEDALETGFGEQIQRRAFDAEPLAARLI